MFKQRNPSIRFTAIVCFVLVSAFTAAWAVQTYYASEVIKKGKGGNLKIVNQGEDKIGAKITNGSLDVYLEEQGLNEVEIQVEMTEELVECSNDTHYHLEFTFGPSGAYMDPPLKLILKGKYVETGCNVWLFDENGEAVEGKRSDESDKIVFEIPHFSVYGYDDYDYY
jgi:hypothetical protein